MKREVIHLVAEIVATLQASATPERAIEEKRYLKSDLAFLGASAWETGRVAKAIVRREGLDRDDALALAAALWDEPVHERRAAAVAVLEEVAGQLTPTDLPIVERLLRESRTWALVDGLAADVVGPIAARHPHETAAVLDRWAVDADFWIRRSSLLAELGPLRDGGPLAPFATRADQMLDEREFFIRKAIGWVLREVGKRRPAEVIAWLEPRTDRASGVTMREAVKYLPAADRERLMAAYRSARPAGSAG